MGAGFLEELSDSSNHALLEIIEHVGGFASTVQSFWIGSDEISWDSDWIWARSSALMHKLLSLEALPAPPPSPNSDASEQQLDMLVEECTRLGIVVWLYCGFFLLGLTSPRQGTLQLMVRNPMNFFHMQERLIRIIMELGRFVSTLSQVDDSDELALPKHCMLMLWILGLCVLAAADKEEFMWISRHFIAISRSVGIMQYEEFEDRISTRYLCLRSLEEASDRQLTKVYQEARLQDD